MVIVLKNAGKIKKKIVLFLEIGQAKLFFYLPANICVSEYMPFVSKKVIKNTDTNKKETKEEKEIEKLVAVNSIQQEI